VIKYECCLTIKQYIFLTSDRERMIIVLNQICPVVCQLFRATRVPQVIWHLIYFINSLIEKSAYNRSNELLQALVTTNIAEIMLIEDQVVRTAFSEMLEGLAQVYTDELYITQVVVSFISLVPNKNDHLQLWHTLIINVDASEVLLGEILKLEPLLLQTQWTERIGAIKIIEETYLYYDECKFPATTFFHSVAANFLNFAGDTDVLSR
jgi:hypothetical protein